VANKVYENVDARTVRGLAKAFDVTEQELWDVVNGVTQNSRTNIESREVFLPAPLWRLIDSASGQTRRDWNDFVEAVFSGYFGADVNIDLDKLTEMRKADAVIIPLTEGGKGELPFTTEDPARKSSVKYTPKSKSKNS
jgi:hypothetical protein